MGNVPRAKVKKSVHFCIRLPPKRLLPKHPLKFTQLKEDLWPADVKLQFLFLQANVGKQEVLSKINLPLGKFDFKLMALLEKLCVDFQIPNYEELLRMKDAPMWALYKAGDNATTQMLDHAFERHSWMATYHEYGLHSCGISPDQRSDYVYKATALIDIFYTAKRLWPQWFLAKFFTMPIAVKLAVAFVYPEVIPDATLPDQMPKIEQILCPYVSWSFEKAEYFKSIFAKYGFADVTSAMAMNSWYKRHDFSLLEVINDPSKVPCSEMLQMPIDLTEKEQVASLSFLSHRNN